MEHEKHSSELEPSKPVEAAAPKPVLKEISKQDPTLPVTADQEVRKVNAGQNATEENKPLTPLLPPEVIRERSARERWTGRDFMRFVYGVNEPDVPTTGPVGQRPTSPEMVEIARQGQWYAAKPGAPSREDEITAVLREFASSPVGGVSQGVGHQGARALAEVERLTEGTTTGRIWDFSRGTWVISTRVR